MRYSLSFILLFITLVCHSQAITIKGVAPSYSGSQIELYEIEDYLSLNEKLIATSSVKADSTFRFNVSNLTTQQLVVKSGNNKGFLYVQPGGNYTILFPEKDKYAPSITSGNIVELSFYDLDSTDINYKLLSFQRWVDHFIGNFYHIKSTDPIEFSSALDRFKTNAEKAYKEDTSFFFKVYVKYTMAGLDNIQTNTERNRYEKYDFYLKKMPVQYKNEAYMAYLSGFYQQLFPRLPNKTNEAVYNGVLSSSPTMIVRALSTEYTLDNLRLRELVMIKLLSEAYSMEDFPKTNIITIIDSLSERTFYPEHKAIAKNIKERLLQLNPGGIAPNFALVSNQRDVLTLSSLQGKHVYLHFFDPSQENNLKEIQLLKELHEKYGNIIHFVSIYEQKDSLSENATDELKKINWNLYPVSSSNSIWKRYKIRGLSHYTLIDAAGYIVASPSLKPTPNGQYETIDKTFFYISKYLEREDD